MGRDGAALRAAHANGSVRDFFLTPLLDRRELVRGGTAALAREAYALARAHLGALCCPLALWIRRNFGAGGRLLEPAHVYYQVALLNDVQLLRFAFFALHGAPPRWDAVNDVARRKLLGSRLEQVMTLYHAVHRAGAASAGGQAAGRDDGGGSAEPHQHAPAACAVGSLAC